MNPSKRPNPGADPAMASRTTGTGPRPDKVVYTEADLPPDLSERLGEPGSFPFARGIYPDMYRGRLWTMRQYAGFSTAEASNARYRYLIGQGGTGLSVAFDLPTQIGYDSDHPMSEGEVGKVGVAIDSVEDMDRLFEGIPLGQVTTSMTINATAATVLAMYASVAKSRGIMPASLGGTVQNDILKEYAARGTYIYPPEPSMRLIIDLIEWCSREMPRWNTISISGYHIREAGATAAEELGFTLANGIAYVTAARARGLDVNAIGRRISFFFNAHNDLFEEVAKFRAARRLWARIMRERFGVTDEQALRCRFHTQTAGSTLTAHQPENNVVRVTLQALAAVLGGSQSLHTNSADEALSLPSEPAAKTALRTQQIIAFESGVTRTADPLGGSFYVESLTARLESEAEALVGEIDRLGGAVRAIEEGFVQERIGQSAYRYQRAVEEGLEVLVGVNRFQDGDSPQPDLLRVNEEVRERQSESLQRLRRDRSNDAVRRALSSLRNNAAGTTNLMPGLLDAVEARATLGEIADALRDAWGEYLPGG